LFWLGAEFIEQGRTLIDGMQHSNWRIDGSLVSRLGDYPVLGGAVTWLTETLDLGPTEITEFLVTLGQTLLRYAASFGSQMVLGALNTALAFLLMMFLLFSCYATAAISSRASPICYRSTTDGGSTYSY